MGERERMRRTIDLAGVDEFSQTVTVCRRERDRLKKSEIDLHNVLTSASFFLSPIKTLNDKNH